MLITKKRHPNANANANANAYGPISRTPKSLKVTPVMH
jgi:hypothetical protein